MANKLLSFLKNERYRVLTGVDNDNLAPLCFREIIADMLPMIIIVPTTAVAERLSSELVLWQEMEHAFEGVTLIPEPSDPRKINPETEVMRHRIAHQFTQQIPRVVITSPMAFLAPALPDAAAEKAAFTLHKNQSISPEELLSHLVALDYDDELEVNIPGEFSRRGGIVDIFAPASEYPVRVEFFGNTIDSLRLFSVLTQRTIENIDTYEVSPKVKHGVRQGRNYLDCIGTQNCRILIVHPNRCDYQYSRFGDARYDALWHDLNSLEHPMKPSFFWEGVAEDVEGEIAPASDIVAFMQEVPLLSEQVQECSEVVRLRIAEVLLNYIQKSYSILLSVKDLRHNQAVLNWMKEYQIPAQCVKIVASVLPTGYIFEKNKLVFLSENEIFYTPHQRKIIPISPLKKQSITLRKESGFQYVEMNENDYAVHLLHGICRFRGIQRMELEGLVTENLELEFAEEKTLYVPIHQIHLLSRYAGTGRGAPSLHKITGNRWENMKQEALLSIKKLAADLIRMQAVRATSCKEPFPPETDEEYRFAAMFPYRETPDQMRAIIDTQNDMMSKQPMDRLVCGDVGYGKTEVAIRAIFKAVQSGKQVAFLAPTTILAQQHFFTLSERFAEYPITVDVMSRFRSHPELRSIIARLKTGGLDVVVGTHRLIQDDVGFKNLGLIVVDEEQRFGVEHKEKLKRMRLDVDILTLSATPIPRTLYMSMTGLRDLSTLATAPENRRSVETFIIQRNMPVLVEAMEKELSRDGQVFYLHNRVQSIQKVRDNLQKLMPNARIAFAHGQMEEGELEHTMSRFIEHHIDILVCTTIIESGVDIPNANTLIVDDAHRFGLSELYQLRGRVGRSNRQAYAYFVLPGIDILTGDARKRMAAIQKYTQLGTGFKLAMRDLEIRGSGNLLGAEQSGHIAHIGFDLYCQMLRQTVAMIKGETLPIYPDAELSLLFMRFAYQTPEDLLPAAIPPDYIPALDQRIAAYRHLAMVTSTQMISDYAEELRDRYGSIPEAVQNFLTAITIKLYAAQCGFTAVRQYGILLLLEKSQGRIYRDEKGNMPLIQGDTPKQKLQSVLTTLKTLARRTTL